MPGRDRPLGAERRAPGRGDGELGRARVVASTDNVGVVEYGLYASGVRVATVSDATATLTNLCVRNELPVAIDAADAAGNRSTRRLVLTNLDVPDDQPAARRHRPGSRSRPRPQTSVDARLDRVDGRRRRRRLRALRGRQAHRETTQHERHVREPAVRDDLRARRRRVRRRRQAVDASQTLSTATSPCVSTPPPTTTATLTQTIANGATLSGSVNWRAVYDANGDKVPDDPGSVRFLVDGKVDADRAEHAVRRHGRLLRLDVGRERAPHVPGSGRQRHGNGHGEQHDDRIGRKHDRAHTPPPPPPTGDTTAPSSPGNLRVTSRQRFERHGRVVARRRTTSGSRATASIEARRQTGQTQQTTTTLQRPFLRDALPGRRRRL